MLRVDLPSSEEYSVRSTHEKILACGTNLRKTSVRLGDLFGGEFTPEGMQNKWPQKYAGCGRESWQPENYE
jgi:hypothetical protein